MQRLSTHRRKFTTAQGREFQVSFFTIRGISQGPVLTVIAGQHGMEHSGPNLLPALIDFLAKTDFAGTVHICPCANPLALEMDYEFYPENEDLSRINDYYYSRFRHNYCPWGIGRDDGGTINNMGRVWNHPAIPGVAGRVTRFLWDEICEPADIVIDLHCLQADKPMIYSPDPKNNLLASCFGVEVIVSSLPIKTPYYGLTHQVSLRPEKFSFCVEFSAQHALKQSEYEMGRRGIRNIMIAAGMLSGSVIIPHDVRVISESSRRHYATAAAGGHILHHVNLYDYVSKGTKLYEIRSFETLEIVDEGFAPITGTVGSISYLPVMKPGDSPGWMSESALLVKAGRPSENLSANFFNCPAYA